MTSVLNVDTIADKAGTGPVTLTKQSAAKAFHGYGNQSAGDLDSNSKTLNISSYLDFNTGRSRLNVTNAFDVSTGQAVMSSAQAYDYGSVMVSTTQYEAASVNDSGNYADGVTHGVVHGDLA